MIISHGKNTNLSLFGKMIYSLLNALRLLVFNCAIIVLLSNGRLKNDISAAKLGYFCTKQAVLD